jgi:arabinofuranosyltransferase
MNWTINIKQNKYFLAFITLFLVIATYITWETVIDDSFITFRYSYNLAKYFKLCWNLSDNPPVEGYSNPLWMILNALAFTVKIDMVLFSKILSIISFILILRIFFIKFHENIILFRLILLMLILIPQTYIHLNSGLETMLYALLMFLVFLEIYDIVFVNKLDYYSIPVLCFLLTTLRPEGFIISSFSILIYFIYSYKLLTNRKKIIGITSIFIILAILFFVFRYIYFGYIFPNTYYVKVGNIKAGRLWIRDSLYLMLPLLIPIVLSLFTKKNIKLIIFSFVFLLFSSASYVISQLLMDYSFRFLYHVTPIILFVFGLIANEFINKKYNKFFIVAFSVIFIVFCWSQRDSIDMLVYGKNLNEVYINFGKRLYSIEIPDEYKSICLGDAGAIPYYSQWDCIDFVGLNDLVIAHKLQEREDYILRKKNTILLLFSSDGIEPYKDQYAFKYEKIIDKYELIGSLKCNKLYYMMAYIKKNVDLETKGKIKSEIEILAASANQNVIERNSPEIYKYLLNRLTSIF